MRVTRATTREPRNLNKKEGCMKIILKYSRNFALIKLLPILYVHWTCTGRLFRLTPPEILALWYIQRFGRKDKGGRKITSRHELGPCLKKMGFTDVEISRAIAQMANKHLVSRFFASSEQKSKLLTPQARGSAAVALTERGLVRLHRLTVELESVMKFISKKSAEDANKKKYRKTTQRIATFVQSKSRKGEI